MTPHLTSGARAPSRLERLEATCASRATEVPVSEPAADPATEAESRGRVLVVDDDPAMLKATRAILVREGYDVLVAESGEAALNLLDDAVDVILTDIQMPVMTGLELLQRARARCSTVEVVLMTAFGTVPMAVRAVRDGAHDFLTKPFESIDQVSAVVRRALAHRRLVRRNRELERSLEIRDQYQEMVGRSAQMRDVFELVESVAYSTSSVLIQGESGTGKELVARAVHERSPRRNKAFIVINCSALTETLLESELFGHMKGAFTGATANTKGLFEAAHGGTIFLDEIGDVPPSTQVKLLRVIQQGEIKKVGSNEVTRVDVRTIAATNVDLVDATRTGRFREDLYYRLNVISITLPPLRERVDDVPLVAHHLLRRAARKIGKSVTSFEPEVLAAFQTYRWPGTVRELENVIERAVVLARGDQVGLRELPAHLREQRLGRNASMHDDVADFGHLAFGVAKDLAVQSFERRYLMSLLQRTNGNISQASREAGLDRSNFKRVLKKYDLDVKELTESE